MVILMVLESETEAALLKILCINKWPNELQNLNNFSHGWTIRGYM
jgi:hypothetical protein